MSYRDGSGWRKKVEWDSVNKVYIYREHEIFPLSWEERNRMPIYLQHNYYWEMIEEIDHLIDHPIPKCTEPAETGFDLFWEFVNGDGD